MNAPERPAAEPIRIFLRFWQILSVLLAEGWAWLFRREPLPDHLYRAVVRLGPTFIKLGQVASTRPDLVPAEISDRFRELQENVPPFSFPEARQVVEAELGRPLSEAFAAFPEQPAAAASLAQVYFARLPDGTPVAVKVQRPGIDRLVQRDLAILRWLARLAGRLNSTARQLQLERAVAEFGRWTLKELDFAVEGHNAETFRHNFAGWDDIEFPQVYWSHTTRRLLTMSRVAGLRLDEVAHDLGLAASHKLAKRLAEVEMKMFITDAFFHADLHPGNIFFGRDGRIAILDLGMVGQMTPMQRDRFLAYWIAITRRQRDRAFHHLLQMAEPKSKADLEGFRSVYDVILDRFYDKALAERSLAQTYLEIVVAGARHGVLFPPEMVLQAKAVVTAEALDLVLAPDFNFSEEVRPIVAGELARRATPTYLADRLWSGLTEWILLGETAPAGAPPSRDLEDENAFRRAAEAALVDVWTDEMANYLLRFQGSLPEYTSAEYWRAHPEHHALLQSIFVSLQLAAGGLSRLGQEPIAPSTEYAPETLFGNRLAGVEGREGRWEAFRKFSQNAAPNGHNPVEDTAAGYGRLAARFGDPDFWRGRYQERAGLMSFLTLLRFLTAQTGQAIHESLQVSQPEVSENNGLGAKPESAGLPARKD